MSRRAWVWRLVALAILALLVLAAAGAWPNVTERPAATGWGVLALVIAATGALAWVASGRLASANRRAEEERARAEAATAALRASEERLRRALAAGAMGTWDWEPARGVMAWSTEVEALYGLAPGAFDGTNETYLGLIHPEDRASVAAAIGQAGERGGDFEVEHRVVWPDGTIRWLLGRGYAYLDGEGRLLRMAGTVMDVTESKWAEEELLASEERFRALADTVPSIVWTAAPDGTITYANERWFEYCGLTPEANARDWPQLVLHPDDRERCEAQWTRALREGSAYEIEVRNRRHDGQFRWFLTRAVPVRDAAGRVTAWFGATTDIHERKQAEEERARLLMAERVARRYAEGLAARLQLAQAAGRIGTFEWCPATNAVTWTAELEALYGLPPGGFGGSYERWRQAVHPDDRERAEHELEAAATTGGELATAFRIVRPDGMVRHLLMQAQMVEGDDGQARLIGVNVDVTEREEALATAQAALRARDEFLAVAAHDLKTPLTGIKGTAQLLRRHLARGEADAAARTARALATIDATATKMTAQIDEFLDLVRLQMGEALPLQRQPTDLVDLARRVAAGQQQATERHQVRVAAGVPALVGDWDADRLTRVVENLIGNAVKYSPDGGEVTVTVARDEAADGAWAVLTVRDRGLGIPAADLERIFERFQRGANVLGRVAGTGLGLASARQIVEQHGGSIAVESREGEGSTFTVRLPLATEAAGSGDGLSADAQTRPVVAQELRTH